MEAYDTFTKHYTDRVLAAKEYKASGGKIVGYFCDYVPDELILAAGFFPLRLSGDPQTVVPSNGYESVEGFVTSMFDMLLAGKYDFLDYLVIPHARDSIYQLHGILSGMKKSDTNLNLPELYLLDSLHPIFSLNQVFNSDRMIEFKQQLERWSEKQITDDSLAHAIAICNENKALLKKVSEFRMAEPPRVSGVEALQIIGSSMFMLKDEHNQILKDYLSNVSERPAREGVRLFVSGSPLDNLQLYEIVESCNATVIAEDNCWGNRCFDVPVDAELDPMEAIVDRYQNKPPCSRDLPLSRRIGYCMQMVEESKIDGVIFYTLESDGNQTWEIPDEIKILEEKGIPNLYLKRQPYLISDTGPLKASIETFVDTVSRKQ